MLPIQYLNIANMVASGLLVGFLLYRHGNEPRTTPMRSVTAVQSQADNQQSPSLEKVFSELEAPLKEAALQKGESPTHILPSDEDRSAALQSQKIQSQESIKVLDTYRRAYEQYDLPFPELYEEPAQGTQKPAQKAEEQIIKAYFQGQLMRIDKAAKEKNIPLKSTLPSALEINESAQSGDISSVSSQKVLTKIQAAYEELNIPFHPPIAQ
jgi:hypothetical protein